MPMRDMLQIVKKLLAAANRRSLLFTLFLCLLSALCASALKPISPRMPETHIQVTLPLQGHYRPGQYMPVRLAGTSDRATAHATLRIDGTDLLPLVLPIPNSQVDAIVPLLALRVPILQIKWTIADDPPHLVRAPLHLLAEDERLVGFTAIDLAFARPLFPGRRIIPISLDPIDPLPGPPAAWEALNAVVFDSPSAFPPGRIPDLLA